MTPFWLRYWRAQFLPCPIQIYQQCLFWNTTYTHYTLWIDCFIFLRRVIYQHFKILFQLSPHIFLESKRTPLTTYITIYRIRSRSKIRDYRFLARAFIRRDRRFSMGHRLFKLVFIDTVVYSQSLWHLSPTFHTLFEKDS